MMSQFPLSRSSSQSITTSLFWSVDMAFYSFLRGRLTDRTDEVIFSSGESHRRVRAAGDICHYIHKCCIAELGGLKRSNANPIQPAFRLLIDMRRKRSLFCGSNIFPQMLRIECTYNDGIHIRMR